MRSQADIGPWWERRGVAILLVLLMAPPFLWPALPPIGDLPGHMGRWHIAMALPTSPDLARYYDYRWALIGNLGLDLIVPALSQVLPFETATKIAVMAIPMLTAAGLLGLAREVHGRVPSTAFLALPLAYAWPFQFGFVNFELAQALALCAFVPWLHWGRVGRLRLRAGLFLPVACLLWLSHSFGWGMFGLMAGASDVARLRNAGRRWPGALTGAAIHCVPLTLPVAFMLSGGAGHGGLMADDWFNLSAKTMWVLSILRDRWVAFDLISLVPLALALYVAGRSRSVGFAAILGWPALLCLAAFVLLPRLLLGGAYVDMRMVPGALMLGLIAIRPARFDARRSRLLAIGTLCFFGIRLSGTTISFVERSAEQQRELAAIDAIPRGAAVLSLVARPCAWVWSDPRHDQLPSMAIVRRDVFTNSQWALDGQQLLRIRHVQAAPYTTDPSQLVFPTTCADVGSHFAKAIADFPRAAFTHVWTIGFPPGAAKARDLRVVWTNGASTLYRVVH